MTESQATQTDLSKITSIVENAVPSTVPEIPAQVKVVFFCKDCEKIVACIKIGGKYVYKCPLCHTKNVAFGTEKSIRSFFRVKEYAEGTATRP